MTTTAFDDQFTPPPEGDILKQARERVAARYPHTYHKNAILSGDWDNGWLVKIEVQAITLGCGE